MAKDRLAQLLIEAEAKAGLTPLDGSLFHAYRRKFATERGHMRDDAVMELMGIEDVKVFKACYSKRTEQDLREALTQPKHLYDSNLERVA